MLQTRIGQPVEALALNADPGLVGTITVEVYDPTTGATVLGPTAAGITEPRPGTYRAELTVQQSGTFAVRWVTPTGAAEEELAVYTVAPIDGEGIRPSVEGLGRIMRARTVDDNGRQLGTFVDPPADDPEDGLRTNPTASEAESIIDTALSLVTARLGSVPASLEDAARAIVALRAAMLVETGHFPQDATPEDSAYAAYREQYRDALADYDAAVQANVGQVRDDLPRGVASVAMPSLLKLASDAANASTP